MTTPEQPLLQQLDPLIDQHLGNPAFSIDDLCRELGLSRSSLYRVVKDKTGLSTTRYVRHRRLLKAKELLIHSDLRVSEIADQVGFDSSQSLSKYFTEAFGSSPSEFRKQKEQPDLLPDAPEQAEAPESVPAKLPAQLIPPAELPAHSTPPQPAQPVGWLGRISGIGRYQIIAFVLGGLVLGGVGWWQWGRSIRGVSTASSNAIAVLPFKNLGSAETAYFSDGVMEQIHTSLTFITNLKVISRRSTVSYANTTKPVDQIARELGVTYLLEGRVGQSGKRVKLSVELIQAADNQTLWSNTYEGDLKDIFGFMSQASKTVADALNQKLSTATRQQMEKAPTQNIEAFNEYLKGQYLMRGRTREGLQACLTNYDRAIRLDSTFADAYVSKSLAYFLAATEGYANLIDYCALAEHNALTAIRLGPENGMAYAMLAKLYQQNNKWEQASDTFLIALKYRPNDALINYWYSLLLRSMGQFDEAIRYSTRALQLDPLYPIIMIGHIGNLTQAKRFDEARRVIADGEPLHQSLYSWYWGRMNLYLNQYDYPTALREIEHGLRLNPSAKRYQTMVPYLQAKTGNPEPARARLQDLPELPENYPDKALLYLGLGDTEHSLSYLEKGAEVGSLPDYLKVSVAFESLHNNPRFRAVLRRVGLTR